MRYIMPARPKHLTQATLDRLVALGQKIRVHRKALGISATMTAQAAGMSRITLHRIEAGEPSVTIGAYFNAMSALGIDIGVAYHHGQSMSYCSMIMIMPSPQTRST